MAQRKRLRDLANRARQDHREGSSAIETTVIAEEGRTFRGIG
jgi:hypothetical protein